MVRGGGVVSRRFGLLAAAIALSSLAWGCRTNDCMTETCRIGVQNEMPKNGSFTVVPSIEDAHTTGDLVVDERGKAVERNGDSVYTRVETVGPVRAAVSVRLRRRV